MSNNKRYLIIGTGALGGFYGVKLAKAGFDVHFLARSDYNSIKTKGITLQSRSGDIVLNPVKCYNSVDSMPKGDVIIITIKAFSNNELKDLLPPVIKDSSLLILLQNGLGGEEYLTEFADVNRIFGGLSIVAVSKKAPGIIYHHDFSSLKLGQFNPDNQPVTVSPLLRDLTSDFQKAGISASAVTDLAQARWEKLVWNIPFCGLSVILNADTRQITSNTTTLKLCEEIIADVATAASACGKPISKAFQQQMIDITIKMVPYFPSMKLDFDAGRPLETEAIFGVPLKTAVQAGYHSPYISMLYHLANYLQGAR